MDRIRSCSDVCAKLAGYASDCFHKMRFGTKVSRFCQTFFCCLRKNHHRVSKSDVSVNKESTTPLGWRLVGQVPENPLFGNIFPNTEETQGIKKE